MHDILTVFAHIVPFDDMINQMKDAITKYESSPTDDHKKGIQMVAVLISTKMATDAHKDGPIGLMKEMSTMRHGLDLLSPKDQ